MILGAAFLAAEGTALGRVHQTSHGKPTTTTIPNLQDLAYSYDAVGNITAITDRVPIGF